MPGSTLQSNRTVHLCVLVLTILLNKSADSLQVIYAINCGGPAHTDTFGIKYQPDPSDTGVASDFGRQLYIKRIAHQDQIIYQTERYHTSSFSYQLPIPENGDYVLILKFSEVWFTASDQKVFDIVLNGAHMVVVQLDIFAKVGRGVAHDELVQFRVQDGRLLVGNEASRVNGASVQLQFVKTERDNPKVNAIVLLKGNIHEAPRLPPLQNADFPESQQLDELPEQQQLTTEEEQEAAAGARNRRVSGPKRKDPYDLQPASASMLPVLAAAAAGLPLLFCVCKL